MKANATGESLSVIMVVPTYPFPIVGGLEKQAHELSKSLKYNYRINILVLSTRFSEQHPANEAVEGIQVVRIPWLNSRWKRFLILPWHIISFFWLKRNEFDLVHVHENSPFVLFIILVARIFNLPVLTKLPNVGKYGFSGLKSKSFGNLRQFIILRSTAIVAMSKESIDELITGGFPKRRILSVPNGITPSQNIIPSILKKKNKSNECRIVYVGRITEQKRLDILLQAWVDVVNHSEIKATLEIWGDGPLRPQLENLCGELSIENTVNWLGHVENVRAKLEEIDIFVLPSSHEGNSNAILEAMDAGLPIIATPVGGTSMQIGPAGSQFLVPVGDVESLKEKLIHLINDKYLREKYGLAMHERVVHYFDINKVAGTYLCAYKKLISVNNVDLSECGQLPN